ncbi:MAG: hypothetical protein HY763_15770 [Planctomycetes bacterium]|nr:hypothetical protein [Planctomycetota bacterium]
MPTPDRTTVTAVLDELLTKLRANLVADPPTAARPFRRVTVGTMGVEEHPRPYLTLLLARTRPIGVTQGDKLLLAELTLRVVADAVGENAHASLLSHIGAIEDYLDGIVDVGILDGAAGGDDREWTFDYPRTSAGSRVAVASARQTLVVKVERERNRLPA